MNKSELIEAIAAKTDLSKVAAGRVLDVMLDTIVDCVSHHEDVKLVGFGVFRSTQRHARTGRNPRNGASVTIPAATVPKFSAGEAFKNAVNKHRSKRK